MKEEVVRRPPGLVRIIFGRQAEYAWGLRNLFMICMMLFVFSLFMGFYLGESIPTDLLEEVVGSFPDAESMSFPMLFLFIVLNNIVKSFVWMLLGFLFGIPPLLFATFNGFLTGWISYSFAKEWGLSFTIAGLVPHGIIEIPTVLLSMAAGMNLGYHLINRIRGHGSLKEELNKVMVLFIRRIAPLLLLAAIVEVTITPLVVVLMGFSPQ